MSQDAEWVERMIDSWFKDPVPAQCQQFGCNASVETWCPLCRAFFCAEHDALYPLRKHDCLRGSAEVA